MKVANFNGVGGGTIIYTAHFPRMHPSDFRVRTLDGVADDWPIDYWTLEPFFAENDRMMGVLGPGRRSRPIRRSQPPMPPLPLGKTGTRYAQGDEQARLALVAVRHAPSPRRDYEGRAQCINLGHCTPGCAQGAKASTDITYWPQAIRAGVELRTRCRVREITTNEHGMASGAIYYDADGRGAVPAGRGGDRGLQRRRHAAPAAELGLGALSRTGSPIPAGLVGKNLMLHPWPMVVGLCRRDAGRRSRARSARMWSKEFYETDPSRGFVRGYTLQFGRGTGPVNEAITSAAAGRLPWGEDHHRVYRELLDHRRRHRRRLRGPAGGAQPRHARSGAEGQQRHPGAEDRLHDQREHAAHDGARHRPRRRRSWRPPARRDLTASRTVLNSPGHLLGTARMGNDPERSVVNEWGRCHDVKNLFIVDGSIWVTSRRREPDLDHPGAGALHRRPDEAAPGDTVRLIPALARNGASGMMGDIIIA